MPVLCGRRPADRPMGRSRLVAVGAPGMGGVDPAAPSSRNRVLTALQRRIATIIGELPEAAQFALAGGGALIARGDVEGETRDLDFFGPAPQDVNQLLPAVEQALQDARSGRLDCAN